MTASAARLQTPPIDLDDALGRIRTSGGRITEAKRSVAELLFSTSEARTAEEIADAVEGVDRSVVYRCLGQFEELGIAEHVHLGHGSAVYRRRGLDSVPVACLVCGRTVELALDDVAALRDRVEARTGIELDLAHFPLTGRCERCRAAAGSPSSDHPSP
jgi:Fe2+ or Zn2+ uptake regulation protein